MLIPMPEDHIRYDLLAQAALRGVVRTVLTDAAEKGLPGEHHFEIVFDTTALGVRLSERMRAQYPQAMKIVLQHQFWDLTVDDDKFEVGLSFGGIAERVAVPFDAMMAFYDPAAQFALEFAIPGMQATGDVAAAKPSESSADSENQQSAEKNKPDSSPASDAKQETPDGGAEVVSLDRFRKK
jgi:uncharacterized protein